MTLPDPANAAPETKPVRGWVWHSTDESIAAGQISVLSILETFCALGLYVWLAFHFEYQWWLLVSAVAAPILLLPSHESKKYSLNLLRQYWGANQGSILDNSKKRQDISKKEKFTIQIILLITTLLIFYLIYAGSIQTPARILIYMLLVLPIFPVLVLFFAHPSRILDKRAFNKYYIHIILFGCFSVIITPASYLFSFLLIILQPILTIVNTTSPEGILLRCLFIKIWSAVRYFS